MEKLLEVSVRRKSFAGRGRPVLSGLNIELRPCEFASVIGPSGCGKSTLLRIISGLDADFDGFVKFKGGLVKGPRAECGFVFQESRLFPWMTIRENVSFGARGNEPAVKRLLGKVGLGKFRHHYPRQLSGGMAQKAALARALAGSPELLLLDEPLSSLDAITREKMQVELSRILRKERVTPLLVTHDLGEAVFLSDRIFVMCKPPSRILKSYEIRLPRPRDRESPAFLRLLQSIRKDFSK